MLPYPYELTELSVPAPVDSTKLDSHGPPDEPPVMSQAIPQVWFAVPVSWLMIARRSRRGRLPWYLPAAG